MSSSHCKSFTRSSKSLIATHSDRFSSDGVSPLESLDNPAGPGGNADANDPDSDEEDNTQAIKLAYINTFDVLL